MPIPASWLQLHPPPLNTDGMSFHQVIDLGDDYDVYDFSEGYDPERTRSSIYGVGKYNEVRPGMYLGDQFTDDNRCVHVGIDLAAPVGTAVSSFFDGVIFKLGDNNQAYDYGPTIITRHEWHHQTVYALHGHLSRSSLELWSLGDTIRAGQTLAYLGSKAENGGWNPHLHFQLSLIEPTTFDLPGAVSESQRAWALGAFPDPRRVLAPLYS